MLFVQFWINSTRDVWKFCQNWTSRRGEYYYITRTIPNCTHNRMITYSKRSPYFKLISKLLAIRKRTKQGRAIHIKS